MLTNLAAVGSAAIAFAAALNVSRRRYNIEAPAGWLWLTVGLGLFTLGELSWAVQEAGLGIQNPPPSIADLFWLAGYPALLLGLMKARRQLRVGLENKEIAAVGLGAAAVVGAASAWLLVPIARSRDLPPVEKVLDIAYPLADVILIIPAFTLAIIFGRSLLGRPWRLICIGLIFLGVADLIFSYLTWNRLYWIDIGQVTNFVDLLWVFGYLIIAAGGFYYDQILRQPYVHLRGEPRCPCG